MTVKLCAVAADVLWLVQQPLELLVFEFDGSQQPQPSDEMGQPMPFSVMARPMAYTKSQDDAAF